MCRDPKCSHYNPSANNEKTNGTLTKESVSASDTATFGTSLRFGSSATIAASEVLLQPVGGSCIALSSPRPIVAGHSLVVPRRQVLRLSELSDGELVDLALTLRAAQIMVEAVTEATASNIAIRNGPDVGMPVDHLHMHIVPRRPLDFKENDEVYAVLQSWSPFPNVHNETPKFPVLERRDPRTEEQMAAEATSYHLSLEEETKGRQIDGQSQSFGRFSIAPSQLFYMSDSGLSVASVNLKPLCPGHVLVLPRRVVARLNELTKEEYIDIFRTTRIVVNLMERIFHCNASLVACQDGLDSGQSVPHVHIHILPQPRVKFRTNSYTDILHT
jgi:bis(5'-adenosyl)-triphosphatase